MRFFYLRQFASDNEVSNQLKSSPQFKVVREDLTKKKRKEELIFILKNNDIKTRRKLNVLLGWKLETICSVGTGSHFESVSVWDTSSTFSSGAIGPIIIATTGYVYVNEKIYV